MHRYTHVGAQGSSLLSESLEGDYCCDWNFFTPFNKSQKSTRSSVILFLISNKKIPVRYLETQCPFLRTVLVWRGYQSSAIHTRMDEISPFLFTAAQWKGNSGSKCCSPGASFRHSNMLGPENQRGLFWREVQAKDISQGNKVKPHPSCCPGGLG